MILNTVKPTVESFGLMQESFFSIEDPGMIFEILRSKMYSNPILAICREYSCNALDAHREVGTPDLPIEIHLPSGLEPEYRIKDFGIGISPDRMENVFIKYTASTKRNDNVQKGAFGLGCKCAYSYTDSFIINSIYNGIKYHYTAYIDPTRVGKLSLLNKINTDLPNGTEIVIPVKHQDFSQFREWTEHTCRHWKVKPIITGGKDLEWKQLTKIMDGHNWMIASTTNWEKAVKLIIDGIEYPLELEALKKYASIKLIESAKGILVLYFNTGELSLSASREQIYLDKPTQLAIKNRLDQITQELKLQVETKINNFPNLWDANVYYRKELSNAFSDLGFLGALTWKGNILNHGAVSPGVPIVDFQKGAYSRYKNQPDKITSSKTKHIDFMENTELWINDLNIDNLTPRHVKKAFENKPKTYKIQVITPTDKITEVDLNKSIHLDLLTCNRLSSITKKGKPYQVPSSRLLVFRFCRNSTDFFQVSHEEMESDKNEKVFCLLTRPTQGSYGHYALKAPIINKVRQNNFQSVLNTLLLKNPKISFYGAYEDNDPVRLKKEFTKFKKIDDIIDREINNQVINHLELKYACSLKYNQIDNDFVGYDKIESLIDDKNCIYLKRLHLHQRLKDIRDNGQGILKIYESIKGTIDGEDINKWIAKYSEMDVDKINRAYHKAYPLLKHVSEYEGNLNHIAQYVNLLNQFNSKGNL